MTELRVSPARAAELTRKLAEIMNDLHAEEADPDGVPLNLLIGSFVPADPPGR